MVEMKRFRSFLKRLLFFLKTKPTSEDQIQKTYHDLAIRTKKEFEEGIVKSVYSDIEMFKKKSSASDGLFVPSEHAKKAYGGLFKALEVHFGKHGKESK